MIIFNVFNCSFFVCLQYLGVSGLTELKAINPTFGLFETSLFDEESRSFERAVETRQANTKLDQQINKFLFLLSPYFPLRAAHKALEWLITRYIFKHLY